MISTLLIIDAMNLIRRIYAVQEKQQSSLEKALQITASMTCNAVTKLIRIHQPTHIIAVFDSHAPSWRHSLFPEYKQGRKTIPDPLRNSLAKIQDELFSLGVESLITETDESNDLIATLACKMAKRQQRTIIVSTDKGFYQLLNQYTLIYNYFKGSYFDQIRVENEMLLAPDKLCDFWALTGISSSAIKGVEGVGPKGALSLLQAFLDLQSILSQPAGENKRLNKVLADKENALLAYKLVQLKKECELGFNLKDLRYIPSTQ
jgi:protein Xni